MNGPRVTVRVTQLVRSISTSPAAATPKTANSGTLITSSKAAAPLSRKYADLLRERNIEWDSAHHPRSMTTRSSNRPHPTPQTLRIMQTFSTTAPTAASTSTSPGLDHIVLPGAVAFDTGVSRDPYASVRVPLLPDSAFSSPHSPEVADGPLPTPEISIVAANPELVQSVSALTEVEGMNVDGIELKFIHDGAASSAISYSSPSTADEPESGGGMLRDIWKGLVDDFSHDTAAKAAGGKLSP
ncbi:hypothetical protein Micbo1qcDRAFT_195680 [Microdochium bolleyi]|uniref:Uncharacterized protein n=1 Tax=Microdochium bolleyi TaxID=196109 RepID=A0A136J167_9PEZI|nr:hypothetical protein Micbo1qcDRAFT_195680 [Microdochium bolleyi]